MKKAFAIILFLIPFFCPATTLFVTNNSSGGAGSLYQAMQDAAQNGSATSDTIAFNLPANQTTIQVSAPLIVSSNMVIDGATQPTRSFGLSGTNVRLQASGCVSGLVLNNITNVEIYGLWFSDFNASSLSCTSSAISLRNTSHLILGKPGKGNCFSNNRYSIINPWQLGGDNTENVDITIQANRFGMDTTTVPDYTSSTLAFGATRKFLFGGDNASEGNRIGNGFVTVGNFYVPLSAQGDTIAFKNNSFGFDAFNGPLISTIGLYVAGYKAARSGLNVIISNNKIGKDDETNKMWITDIQGNIQIKDNYIGSLNTAVTPGDLVSAIYLENCLKKDSIIIRDNIINGYKEGIAIVSTKNVTISNNSIYCNQKGIRYFKLDEVPIVSFLELTSSYLKGSTEPLSKIEIFTTSVCNQYCENGKSLVATVMADNNGFFEYSGNLSGTISATATNPTGTTSEFYGPKFTIANLQVKNPTCGQPNGFIRGIKIIKGTVFHWEDENGQVVGTDTSISNLGAGQYRFYLKDSLSSCPVFSPFYTLKMIAKPNVDSTFTVVNTSCAKSFGKIILNGNRTSRSLPLWQDSLYKTLQTGGDSILNLPPGVYYYKITLPEDSTCYTPYGPFRVLDKPGPFLNTTQVQIQPTDCLAPSGFIKSITYGNDLGTSFFAWEDSSGKVVANTLELTNQPGGRYRLKYKDESVCDTLVTGYFTISIMGGINFDSSKRVIQPSSCIASDGSITNMSVTGAEYFTWIQSANNTVVGNQPNLTKVPSGYYRLSAGNALGCKDTSAAIFVPQSGFNPISITTLKQQPPHCGLNNGFVMPTTFSTDTLLYRFTWTDSINSGIVSNSTQLLNASGGSYFLSATDTNGCFAKIYSASLVQTGKPVFNYSQMTLMHDTCGLSNGAIANIQVTGGQQPYTWNWYKDGNTIAYSQASNQLTGLAKGSYKVMVKDVFDCTVTGNSILIGDFDKQLPLPLADNQSVQRNTTATFIINNYTAGSYTLYDSVIASLPYSITSGSRITTPIVRYDKTFYIQYTLGNCVSPWQPVLVKVFDKATFTAPNAFSPNGDGINDVWKLQVQGTITLKEWLIFNRYGQQIASIKDAGKGWDGRLNNAPVPTGTYYYVISAVDNDGKLIKQNGSVTVLR